VCRSVRSTAPGSRFIQQDGRNMDCYVYVLGTVTRNRHLTYVGWTDDVARRLTQHNAGKGARSTRGRTWVLLYSERCASKRHAMSREWHLKRDRNFRKELALKIK
jgi:putative endonuclease